MAKTRVGLPQPIGMEVEGEREAVAGGWDELRAAAGDAGPLFQPHHRPWDQRLHLSKPRVPHLQKRGDPSIEGWAFLF